VPRDNAKTRDDAQVQVLVNGWAKAIRAKDADGAMACYAPDAVVFDLAPPLVSAGPDADGLQAWFATWEDPIHFEIRDLNVLAGDDVAFCHSLSRLSGTKTDGEKVDIWFRLTLGCHEIGGEWKIAHQHESVPFHMDGSYRAAVDLKP
jgi:ketosteroid isomerase-like protein